MQRAAPNSPKRRPQLTSNHASCFCCASSQDKVLTASLKRLDDATLGALKRHGIRCFECPVHRDGGFWQMNLLGIGHGRVVVDDSDCAFNERLRSIGLKPIPVAMRHVAEAYCGLFHCTTLDLKRRPG